MSTDGDVEILRQVLDGFNRHDLHATILHFAEDCVFESPRGPDRWGCRLAGKDQVRPGRATIGDGNALAAGVNLFRHTYNTLRPHQAPGERTPRAAYLAAGHCD